MSGHGAVSGRRDRLSRSAHSCQHSPLCFGPRYGAPLLSGKTPLFTSISHIGVLEAWWREQFDEGVWHGVTLDSAEGELL